MLINNQNTILSSSTYRWHQSLLIPETSFPACPWPYTRSSPHPCLLPPKRRPLFRWGRRDAGDPYPRSDRLEHNWIDWWIRVWEGYRFCIKRIKCLDTLLCWSFDTDCARSSGDLYLFLPLSFFPTFSFHPRGIIFLWHGGSVFPENLLSKMHPFPWQKKISWGVSTAASASFFILATSIGLRGGRKVIYIHAGEILVLLMCRSCIQLRRRKTVRLESFEKFLGGKVTAWYQELENFFYILRIAWLIPKNCRHWMKLRPT